MHDSNYDASCRRKQFHTIGSQSTLQIFPVILGELAKSDDCDFSCIKLALQKISVSRKYISSQEITAKLC